MAYVYVLLSLASGQRYVGSTHQSPKERLSEHHRGMAEWTKRHRPFELIYSEVFTGIELARKREKFFKTGKGRLVLDSLLKTQNEKA
jgi:putative endonuclease